MPCIIERHPFLTEGIHVQELCFAYMWEWDYQNLSAPYWRFFWNDTAGAAILLDDRKLELTPEVMLLIPPHTPFNGFMEPIAKNDPPIGSLYTLFKLGEPYDKIPPDLFSFPAPRRTQEKLRRLTKNQLTGQKETVGYELTVIRFIIDLILKIPKYRWPVPIRDNRVERAIEFMGHHLNRPLELGEIAKNISVSISTLTRIFSRETGIPPYQYHLQLRLEKACDLLHVEGASIDETAETCGFVDRAHFSNVFTKKYNLTPVGYQLSRKESR